MTVQDAFPTIFDLRATHVALLSKQRQGAKVDELEPDVRDFVHRAQVTGAYLDADEQRDAAQGLIDYWVTTLYRASMAVDDVTLAEFDAALAPNLADDLCPYVGLEAFREKDSNRFYGRKKMIATAIEMLERQHFVAVVGPSGSGKSSVVLGGLLPALRRGAISGSDTWNYVPPLVPGCEPIKNLEAVWKTGDPACPSVVIVDQFEELFTLCEDLAVRDAFARRIVELAKDHYVIVTMRSDYESRLTTTGELQELFAGGDLRATPLGAPELREAIEEPARLIGLKFESGLVDALVHDVLGEPAALPLLQFTLWKLWRSRDHNRITMASYRRLGGGRAALASSADALYESLIQQDRDTMRRILMRMVRPGAGAEVTSSRVRVRELLQLGDDQSRVHRVLEKLIAENLVRRTGGGVADDDQVEVSHEALIRNWPLLVTWIERQKADLVELRRFELLAEEWERFGRTSGFLDEEQLREAEEWLEHESARDIGIKESLPALVKASRELIEERARTRRNTRRFVISILTTLVLVVIGMLYAGFREARIDAEREHANAVEIQKALNLAKAQKEEAERITQELMTARTESANIVQQFSDVYEPDAPVDRPHNTTAFGGIGSPRERVRPVWPGASIGAIDGKGAGSISCVVRSGRETFLLTLGSVVGVRTGTIVVQPGVGDGGTAADRIGTVVKFTEGDLRGGVLVHLDPGIAVNPSIPNVGRIAGRAWRAKDGETLRLIGRGSGLATAKVVETRPDGQIVLDFEGRGDAGAPVLNAKNELVGIYWGADGKTSFVMPAHRIFTDLGVQLVK